METVSDTGLGFEYSCLPSFSSFTHLLIILFGGIGDLICLTGPLMVVKKRFANIKLGLLTSSFASEFFPNELVDELFIDEDSFWSYCSRLSPSRTLVINLHSTIRSAEISGVLEKMGFPVYGMIKTEKGIFVRGTIFHDLLHRVFYVRFRDSYIANWVMPGRTAMFSLCLGMTEVEEPKISIHISLPKMADEYIVFVPDANAPTRRWPLEHWIELAKLVIKDYDFVPLVLSRERLDGFPPSTINLSGKTTLAQAISYLAGARAVVSNDTGMIHASASLGRPVLVVCGPNNVGPEARGRFLSIRYPVECSPCFRSRCESMVCMKSLIPEMVKSGLDWLIGKGEVDKRLIVGYSWEQELNLFYDLHSLWDVPYRKEKQVFQNLIRWAWLYGLVVEEGLPLDGFADFERYFFRFHQVEMKKLSPLIRTSVERLSKIYTLLLPVKEKVGILIKKKGGMNSKMKDSFTTLLSNIEKELVYPWNYAGYTSLSSYEFVFNRVLQRIQSMKEFLGRYVEK